jgi:glycosyltransferase involved in cell wall biosynthesis
MVYIEALSQGLPVVAHDFMVSRYVLKEYGFYNDLTKEGNLRNTLSEIIKSPLNADQRFQRHQFVYEHYSWEKVKTDYLKLFT